jgi:alcohol dehydrogenase
MSPMRGLFLDGKLLSYRDDLPLPVRQPGEALIAVRLAGVCATDLELLRGYRPLRGIPGHEFVGSVIECDDPGWVAQRVVGEINIACGRCDMCRRGDPTHCRNRSAIGIFGHDGAMAEFLTLPEANLHLVPVDVADADAVFVEPLAAALEVLERRAAMANRQRHDVFRRNVRRANLVGS